MTKLAAPLAVAALFAGFASAPANAQDQSTTGAKQRVSEIIVFGTDPCPRSTVNGYGGWNATVRVSPPGMTRFAAAKASAVQGDSISDQSKTR